jgi:hypothetical protein
MAVGFRPAPVDEVEELREAHSSLNDIARNLAHAIRCLEQRDLKMLRACLTTAEWHTEQAKKSIVPVGHARTNRAGENDESEHTALRSA